MNWVNKTRLLMALIFIPLVLSGSGSGPIYADQGLFEYNQNSPIKVSKIGVKLSGSVEIREITYTSLEMKRKVPALLVVPAGKGTAVKAPFAGIIFLHMYPGYRDQFLDEAVALADMGVVSLLIDGFFPWHVQPKSLTDDCQSITQQIIELRRAVDLLIARKDIDPKRIAFVGMDYGAMHGGVLAGVEKRIKSFVLIAGTTRYWLWSAYWIPGESASKTYQEAMKPLDPITGVSQAGAPILFQFSTEDGVYPVEDAKQFSAVANEEKSVKWYASAHGLLHVISRDDRDEWLREQLSLPDQKK